MAAPSAESLPDALPPRVAALFWEYEPRCLDPDRHRDIVIARVLSRGDWQSIDWLRSRYGDAEIRDWLLRTGARQLDRRSVRLWQVVLDLPADQVEAWLATPERAVWDHRTRG